MSIGVNGENFDYTSYLERVTDAGTRPLIRIPPHVDDIPYNEDEWDDEDDYPRSK